MINPFKRVKGNGPDIYGAVSDDATQAARKWMGEGGYGGKDISSVQRGQHFGGQVIGNLQNAAREEGRSVLGMAGSHAIRGAAWGAVAGGSVEAAQGGSFWDGAKQGAFNGAVGWGGYRMAMKGVGAKSLNPLASAGKNGEHANNMGLFSAAGTMWRSTSGNAQVSKQAIAIMNNRQQEGLARSIMNSNS